MPASKILVEANQDVDKPLPFARRTLEHCRTLTSKQVEQTAVRHAPIRRVNWNQGSASINFGVLENVKRQRRALKTSVSYRADSRGLLSLEHDVPFEKHDDQDDNKRLFQVPTNLPANACMDILVRPIPEKGPNAQELFAYIAVPNTPGDSLMVMYQHCHVGCDTSSGSSARKSKKAAAAAAATLATTSATNNNVKTLRATQQLLVCPAPSIPNATVIANLTPATPAAVAPVQATTTTNATAEPDSKTTRQGTPKKALPKRAPFAYQPVLTVPLSVQAGLLMRLYRRPHVVLFKITDQSLSREFFRPDRAALMAWLGSHLPKLVDNASVVNKLAERQQKRDTYVAALNMLFGGLLDAASDPDVLALAARVQLRFLRKGTQGRAAASAQAQAQPSALAQAPQTVANAICAATPSSSAASSTPPTPTTAVASPTQGQDQTPPAAATGMEDTFCSGDAGGNQ